jgi:hypothetical protein
MMGMRSGHGILGNIRSITNRKPFSIFNSEVKFYAHIIIAILLAAKRRVEGVRLAEYTSLILDAFSKSDLAMLRFFVSH